MAAAPADEGLVKWQLCYDMRAKTWWMVSQGGRVGDPGSGLGQLILEGWRPIVGQKHDFGPRTWRARAQAGTEEGKAWGAIHSLMVGWLGGFPAAGRHAPTLAQGMGLGSPQA